MKFLGRMRCIYAETVFIDNIWWFDHRALVFLHFSHFIVRPASRRFEEIYSGRDIYRDTSCWACGYTLAVFLWTLGLPFRLDTYFGWNVGLQFHLAWQVHSRLTRCWSYGFTWCGKGLKVVRDLSISRIAQQIMGAVCGVRWLATGSPTWEGLHIYLCGLYCVSMHFLVRLRAWRV